MLTNQFQGLTLPRLGFGAMRLPTLADGTIDEAQTAAMVAYAMEHGVNYFDTAYPYHNGNSERVIGKLLSQYDRNSYYLADKYPGHQLSSSYDPAAVFEDQLQKCGVDYFDFYLLHNVYENSMKVYLDPQWGIIDYFKEQKRLGRIKHLGFSSHCRTEHLREFLDACGEDMEFCQIQLNYLDWTLQDAKTKYDLLTERGIPVWVMEPVRGGKLANLAESEATKLTTLRPDESVPAWAFRFLQDLPNVKVILSGMSNMDQVTDNIKTFSNIAPLNEEETRVLLEVAETMKGSIPCTACRYCCDGCPAGLNIPLLLSLYNDHQISPSINITMAVDAFPDDKRPSACIGCGKCTQICPQGIDVPGALKSFTDVLSKLPSWAEVCRQRQSHNAHS